MISRSPSTALLIKDQTRNIFYELEDPRDVQDRCVIKIYCKEPIYGTYPGHHNPHLANGDLRVSNGRYRTASGVTDSVSPGNFSLQQFCVVSLQKRRVKRNEFCFGLDFSFVTNLQPSRSSIWSEIRK